MVSATPNCVGVIPARAGSQGIPGKNSRLFLNRPLVEWSILSAIESDVFQKIVVTTDCPMVADISRKYPIALIYPRPAELCSSTTPTAPVIAHAVDTFMESQLISNYPDYVFVLEPTSPGRRPIDIENVYLELRKGQAESVATVSDIPHHHHPAKQLRFKVGAQLEGFMGQHPGGMTHRRQELEPTVGFDGMIFSVLGTVLKSSPPDLWGPRVHGILSDPSFVVDLDYPYQWELAERQLAPWLLRTSDLEEGENDQNQK